jgi:hypothetical protein
MFSGTIRNQFLNDIVSQKVLYYRTSRVQTVYRVSTILSREFELKRNTSDVIQ